jgi:hypothetical protein
MQPTATTPAPGAARAWLSRAGLLGPLRALREALATARWAMAGRPAPAPHAMKRRRVKALASRHGCTFFVETGTFEGDMVRAVLRDFERIYSIELGEALWKRAKARFAGEPHATLLQGDSARVLGEILPGIDRPCLFWLDGHYSAGETARAERDTPILAELAHIAAHPLRGRHVVLIDDARLFTGSGDYPTLESIRTWARAAGYEDVTVVDDMIAITPARPSGSAPPRPPSRAPRPSR